MFKVIIADDEPKVCQLIQKLGDWDELGLVVTAVAYNGLEALNLITNQKPDIVITDIRMPGLDGLELIKKVKEQGLEPNFIIISGYRHFEYAYNAIKYNVTEYLLKPIKKNELNEVLKKICQTLVSDNIRMIKEHEIESRLTKSRHSLRKHFVSDLMYDMDKITHRNIEDINIEYQFEFRPGIFQACFIKIDSAGTGGETQVTVKLLEKISDIGQKYLREHCYEICLNMTRSGVIFILNYDENNVKQVKKSIKLMFEKIAAYLGIFGKLNQTIGIGGTQKKITNLNRSIQSAADAVKCRLALGVNRVICADDLNLKYKKITDILTIKKESQLVNIFDSMDTDAFNEWLTEVFSAFAFNTSENPCIAFETCEKIADILIRTTRTAEPDTKKEEAFLNKISIGLEDVKNMQEMHEFIRQAVTEYMESLIEERRLQDNKPIRLAKQYIAAHYKEQIKLDDVAGIVHLNLVYFSTIFKKETGMNFSDYLITHRLEAAKELLKSTNLTISEIAKTIGYANTKYFSKLFSKVIGIKPSEYRKLYS